MKILAVSGSLRKDSSNTHVLRALMALAPDGIEVVLCPPLDGLPFFNPDVEQAGLPAEVEAWRRRIGNCEGLVLSSPEYAHGVSGVLKNALDWLVGGPELTDKPIAVLNAKPQATLAHRALVETLRVMGGDVVVQPAFNWAGRHLDASLAAEPELAALLVATLKVLQVAADRRRGQAAPQ